MTDDALEALARWHRAGRAAALATVVRTDGSVPRPVGAKLAISDSEELAGSVSGGCVEGDVVRLALEVMRSAEPQLAAYGISDEAAMTVGLMCGGQIEVLVEPITSELAAHLDRFAEALAAGEPAMRRISLRPESLGTLSVEPGPPAVIAADEMADTLPITNRLWIVGAGHVAEHTAAFAEAIGMRVTVIDPRRLYAGQPRLAGVRVEADWPDRVLSAAGLSEQDAVVVLSHDPKIDEPALRIALPSPAFYVGAIGSRTAQADRRDRLLAAGLAESDLARLHAPIGLDLGGREPVEIAIAIVAEVIAARHGRPLGAAEHG